MKGKIETCRRCGRKLKTEKSIELGFGRVCYQKYLEEQAQIGFMDNQMSMDEIAN
ncbi:MAG TPA: DUF6011 domain-containing protein [Virgibacillus sp.]|nr:DUF6011 domain-containing protein [Virgibacillus sp.]HLR69447.1 DUF6011 domain-containing protein [Virgibacillus sp.]